MVMSKSLTIVLLSVQLPPKKRQKTLQFERINIQKLCYGLMIHNFEHVLDVKLKLITHHIFKNDLILRYGNIKQP